MRDAGQVDGVVGTIVVLLTSCGTSPDDAAAVRKAPRETSVAATDDDPVPRESQPSSGGPTAIPDGPPETATTIEEAAEIACARFDTDADGTYDPWDLLTSLSEEAGVARAQLLGVVRDRCATAFELAERAHDEDDNTIRGDGYALRMGDCDRQYEIATWDGELINIGSGTTTFTVVAEVLDRSGVRVADGQERLRDVRPDQTVAFELAFLLAGDPAGSLRCNLVGVAQR